MNQTKSSKISSPFYFQIFKWCYRKIVNILSSSNATSTTSHESREVSKFFIVVSFEYWRLDWTPIGANNLFVHLLHSCVMASSTRFSLSLYFLTLYLISSLVYILDKTFQCTLYTWHYNTYHWTINLTTINSSYFKLTSELTNLIIMIQHIAINNEIKSEKEVTFKL